MHSSENKKLMQEIFAGVAQGDGRMFVQHLADDVEMTITGQYSWSQTVKGKPAVIDFFRHFGSLIEGPTRTLPFRILADEDFVVIEARGDMQRKDGPRYDNHYCLIYRLREGMIVEIREYQDSWFGERVLGPNPFQTQAPASSAS
jgi:uncharacterized protein